MAQAEQTATGSMATRMECPCAALPRGVDPQSAKQHDILSTGLHVAEPLRVSSQPWNTTNRVTACAKLNKAVPWQGLRAPAKPPWH